jgi:UbiD family decarboxylase
LTAAYQSLRGFISLLDRTHPGEVVRIAEPVDLAYQMQALALELERRRRFPVLIFEQVRGHSIPVISNVMASRKGLATALGVSETELPAAYAARLKEPVKPVVLPRPPFPVDVRRGEAADLGALPIPTYFPGDGGAYLTAGLLVARDPANLAFVTQTTLSMDDTMEIVAALRKRFPARRRQPEKYVKEIEKKAQEIGRYALPVATCAYLRRPS